MKQFKDETTGRKFQLGSRGPEALLSRVRDYVDSRREAGVNEVSLAPVKMEKGSQYECSACNHIFTYDGDDYDAFIDEIKQHGRNHGQCSILPVLS